MDEATQRNMLISLDNLKAFVQAGGHIEVNEPRIRGRKGPDHSAVRHVSIRIFNPGRYDALCWDRMRESMRRNGPC